MLDSPSRNLLTDSTAESAVMLEEAHMCSMMRGVKKENARMSTSRLLGEFKENRDVKNQFLNQI